MGIPLREYNSLEDGRRGSKRECSSLAPIKALRQLHCRPAGFELEKTQRSWEHGMNCDFPQVGVYVTHRRYVTRCGGTAKFCLVSQSKPYKAPPNRGIPMRDDFLRLCGMHNKPLTSPLPPSQWVMEPHISTLPKGDLPIFDWDCGVSPGTN